MKRALFVLYGLLLSAPAYAAPLTWESPATLTDVAVFSSSTAPQDSLKGLFSVGDPFTMLPTFDSEWTLTRPGNHFAYGGVSESFNLDITIGSADYFSRTGGFANRLGAGDTWATMEFKKPISGSANAGLNFPDGALQNGHWHLGLDHGVPVRHGIWDGSVGDQFPAVQSVPEPSTLLAVGLGLVTMVASQIRRRH